MLTSDRESWMCKWAKFIMIWKDPIELFVWNTCEIVAVEHDLMFTKRINNRKNTLTHKNKIWKGYIKLYNETKLKLSCMRLLKSIMII